SQPVGSCPEGDIELGKLAVLGAIDHDAGAGHAKFLLFDLRAILQRRLHLGQAIDDDSLHYGKIVRDDFNIVGQIQIVRVHDRGETVFGIEERRTPAHEVGLALFKIGPCGGDLYGGDVELLTGDEVLVDGFEIGKDAGGYDH